MNLHGVTYYWRLDEFPEKHFSSRRQIGVIAQEVEKQFPEAVNTDVKGFKSVNYPALLAPVIEAIRELYEGKADNVRMEQLQRENEKLRMEQEQMKIAFCELGKKEFCVTSGSE